MSDILIWPVKDPQEVLDYRIDWSHRLTGSEVITSSTWAMPAGTLVIDSASYDTTSSKVWLSGGTADTAYALTNTIETSGNRIYEQSVILPVAESSIPSDACRPPNVAEFRVRFPEFVDISEAQVQVAIDDASCWADSSWIATCNDCTKAIAYLAAHFLALGLFAAEMLPDTLPSETPGGPAIIPGGTVTSIRFESMSVGFSAPKAVGGQGGDTGTSGIGDQWAIGGTPYGQMYLMLVKVNQPAVLVV